MIATHKVCCFRVRWSLAVLREKQKNINFSTCKVKVTDSVLKSKNAVAV